MSVVPGGAVKANVPDATVSGTTRSATFWSGLRSLSTDHSWARTVPRWVAFRVAPITALMLTREAASLA